MSKSICRVYCHIIHLDHDELESREHILIVNWSRIWNGECTGKHGWIVRAKCYQTLALLNTKSFFYYTQPHINCNEVDNKWSQTSSGGQQSLICSKKEKKKKMTKVSVGVANGSRKSEGPRELQRLPKRMRSSRSITMSPPQKSQEAYAYNQHRRRRITWTCSLLVINRRLIL